jgi:hypothetical protein
MSVLTWEDRRNGVGEHETRGGDEAAAACIHGHQKQGDGSNHHREQDLHVKSDLHARVNVRPIE